MNKDSWYLKLLAAALTVIVVLATIAAIGAAYVGALWVIFWCFSLQFTFKAAMGILLITILVVITIKLVI